MRAWDVVRLVVLGAIWGASFLFMRIIADELGAMGTACSRVLIAEVVLCVWLRAVGIDFEWRRRWRSYTVIGVVNSAIPFALYGFAAQHIPASYSAVINSMAPVFGMVLSAVLLSTHPSVLNMAGAAMGMAGVAVLTIRGPMELTPVRVAAVVACVAAAACYAIAGVYIKKRAGGANPGAVAGASQLMAGLVLVPGVALAPPPGPITWETVVFGSALALVCSGAAYLIYYRLIADCGPTRALTVTYLIPLFGIGWGALFLGEAVTSTMMLGCAMVVGGIVLVVRKGRAVEPAGGAGAARAT
jgi:drug/metabolite transporter (DMT)-like permease